MTENQESLLRELLTQTASGGFNPHPAKTFSGKTMSYSNLDKVIEEIKRILEQGGF